MAHGDPNRNNWRPAVVLKVDAELGEVFLWTGSKQTKKWKLELVIRKSDDSDATGFGLDYDTYFYAHNTAGPPGTLAWYAFGDTRKHCDGDRRLPLSTAYALLERVPEGVED